MLKPSIMLDNQRTQAGSFTYRSTTKLVSKPRAGGAAHVPNEKDEITKFAATTLLKPKHLQFCQWSFLVWRLEGKLQLPFARTLKSMATPFLSPGFASTVFGYCLYLLCLSGRKSAGFLSKSSSCWIGVTHQVWLETSWKVVALMRRWIEKETKLCMLWLFLNDFSGQHQLYIFGQGWAWKHMPRNMSLASLTRATS